MSSIESILSDQNPKFKRWKRLATEPRALKKFGATLAEGAHLTEVFGAERGLKVVSVVFSETATEEAKTLGFYTLDQHPEARAFVLAPSLYKHLSPVEHGVGVMLEVEIPTETLPDELDDDLLYLDGVQDAGNAGTLIRTALAAGIRHVAASPKTAQLWSPKVLRAAMGAHAGVRLYENVTVEDLAQSFQGTILAADARGGEDLFAADDYTREAVCWIFGAEGPGVSEEALAKTARRFYIPIEDDCESLNVAAAAAVCLFDTRRRRLA